MGERAEYSDISAAIAPSGMVVRGGFATTAHDALEMPDGRLVRSVVIIGNVGGAMWQRFRDGQQPGPHPLDRWTRATLVPIAASFGAAFVHPSDEPFRPFQRWAQRADDVWPSPIGLLIHGEYGLWHAYRGAFLFAEPVDGLPPVGRAVSPCVSCVGRPCLTACPVTAFTPDGYDAVACASHVGSGGQPDCMHDGCAARRACPIGADHRYGADQMLFHMRAFVGA
jgi:ferredoxin